MNALIPGIAATNQTSLDHSIKHVQSIPSRKLNASQSHKCPSIPSVKYKIKGGKEKKREELVFADSSLGLRLSQTLHAVQESTSSAVESTCAVAGLAIIK